MTQEDKELLLKDLCARLPYGVIVKLDDKFKFNKGDRVLVKELLDLYCIEGIKPYLRPMSSMTEDEEKDLEKISWQLSFDRKYNLLGVGAADDGWCSLSEMCQIIEYLNSHHFDYRGLIEKGLALEAPKGMYK